MAHSTARPLLVLQHIACEPPAAYEDELRAWGVELHRVEIDEAEPLPEWRGYAGIVAMGGPMGASEDDRHPWLTAERSEAYEQQAFVFGRAYGLQFHLEVDGARASAWGDVPAYAESLTALLGDGALPSLVAELKRHEARSIVLARRLLAAWLEHVVGVPVTTPRRPRTTAEAVP
jgi:GMP synthase-like glutamine amidotransferase